MKIEIDEPGLRNLITYLEARPRQVLAASTAALNRAADSGRVLMTRLLAADLGAKQADVKAKLRVQNATYSRPAAAVGTASRDRISLAKFGAKQTKTGVSYRLAGKTSQIPHGFIATMKSGHVGIFERKMKARLPIQEKLGPSLGHVFGKFRTEVSAHMSTTFKERFLHELSRRLGDNNSAGE